MSDHAPFLAAILARPADDLPRLIYADALEKGDEFPPDAERAEFIRVQIEIARQVDSKLAYGCCGTGHGDPGGTCIWCRTRRRERELLLRVYRLLLPDLDGRDKSYWPDHDEIGYSTRPANPDAVMAAKPDRGFPSEWRMSWSDFRTHAAAIMAATPLRRVRLTTRPNYEHGAEVYMGSDGHTLKWLARKYPGIEFEMPQPPQYRVEWGEETVVAPAGSWTRD